MPQESREAFDRLERAGILPAPIAASMRAMVGFRTVAVQQYRAFDLHIERSIVRERLGDFLAHTEHLLRRGPG